MITDIQLEKLLQDITSNYISITLGLDEVKGYSVDEEVMDNKVKNFENNLSIKKGEKYIKIISGESTWGFINVSHPEFFEGDIFEAYDDESPLLNIARGNVTKSYSLLNYVSPMSFKQMRGG